MNVLSINKYYWKKGGSESVFFSEKEMLESKGHLVIPFSMQGEKNELSPYSKYFVNEVDYSKQGIKNRLLSATKIIYSFDAKKKMQMLLLDYSPDLAHFHIFQHQISPSVFGPLKKKNIPIVLTLHDLKPICPNYKMYVNGHVCEECKGQKFYNCYKNRCTKGSVLGSIINTFEMYFHYALGYYQNVDRYIAVSKFYKNKMVEFGYPEEKISYLPNYINADDYDPNITEKGYVLYFGRLSEEKGIMVLFDAAVEIPDIPFYIVGTGPLEDALKKKAQENDLKNVHFLGFKSGIELRTLLTESTCVVVPSEWYENCPMTVLEAFAAGKPVIGSNIGGIPELIDEGIDGFIFQPKDIDVLSEKIKWIWSNRTMAKKMGMQGRKKVEEHFNEESHYVRLMEIYESVL
ncbi:MAG: glycosyltransferase family 4 protein [Bacteroidetes bacterium]|nr:glycosyltransferase family 4 protein [Bacteroidota bacterium]